MSRLLLSCLVPLIFAGCATPKIQSFDTTKSVEFSDSWRDGFLKQDGAVIMPEDAYSKFAADPATSRAVAGYHPWLYSGFALAGAGGYLVGYDLFAKEKKNLWIAGAGLIGLSFWPVTVAENKLKSAAEIHNGRLKNERTKKRVPRLNALVTPIEDGALGLLQITFD